MAPLDMPFVQCGLSCLSALPEMGNVEYPRVSETYLRDLMRWLGSVTFARCLEGPCQESHRHLSATFRAAVCALAVERSRKLEIYEESVGPRAAFIFYKCQPRDRSRTSFCHFLAVW